MLKAGLTGNIGSGKSLVAEVFSVLGVPVYHSDEESKRFLEDPSVADQIRRQFGEGVFTPSGRIDRNALALVVFSDPTKLTLLNGMLHPLVMEDFKKWCGRHSTESLVILESAILFETGLNRHFDRIIHVSCPEETAVERAMRRDGMTREEILRRMRRQMKDREKAIAADFVIRNDGYELVIPQVLEILRLLSEGGA